MLPGATAVPPTCSCRDGAPLARTEGREEARELPGQHHEATGEEALGRGREILHPRVRHARERLRERADTANDYMYIDGQPALRVTPEYTQKSTTR